jgi:hypothetical protein
MFTDEKLNNPEFEKADSVHDWRDYVGQRTRLVWHNLTAEHRRAIAEDANDEFLADERKCR